MRKIETHSTEYSVRNYSSYLTLCRSLNTLNNEGSIIFEESKPMQLKRSILRSIKEFFCPPEDGVVKFSFKATGVVSINGKYDPEELGVHFQKILAPGEGVTITETVTEDSGDTYGRVISVTNDNVYIQEM